MSEWTAIDYALPPQKRDVRLRNAEGLETLGCWDTYSEGPEARLQIVWLTRSDFGRPVEWAFCEPRFEDIADYDGRLGLGRDAILSVVTSPCLTPPEYEHVVKASEAGWPGKALVRCCDGLSAARVRYALETLKKGGHNA